jgi:hypothetical protein
MDNFNVLKQWQKKLGLFPQAGRQAIESDRMPEKGPEKGNRSVLCEEGPGVACR